MHRTQRQASGSERQKSVMSDANGLERAGMPTGGGAVGRLALLTAVFVLLAVSQIRRLKLTGIGD